MRLNMRTRVRLDGLMLVRWLRWLPHCDTADGSFSSMASLMAETTKLVLHHQACAASGRVSWLH